MATKKRRNAQTPNSRNEENNNEMLDIDQLSGENRALYMLISASFESAFTGLEEKLKLKDVRIVQLESEVNIVKRNYSELAERLDEIETNLGADSVLCLWNPMMKTPLRSLSIYSGPV